MTKQFDICAECGDFLGKWRRYEDDVYCLTMQQVIELCKDWRKLFIHVARDMGFNKADAKLLYGKVRHGELGNSGKTLEDATDWFYEFCGNLFYFSDRFSLERLFRVNYDFYMTIETLTGEIGESHCPQDWWFN